jgi:hypothetical protein
MRTEAMLPLRYNYSETFGPTGCIIKPRRKWSSWKHALEYRALRNCVPELPEYRSLRHCVPELPEYRTLSNCIHTLPEYRAFRNSLPTLPLQRMQGILRQTAIYGNCDSTFQYFNVTLCAASSSRPSGSQPSAMLPHLATRTPHSQRPQGATTFSKVVALLN